jgi:drug/metabolite transporter (DMT)-like permease
LALFGDLLCLLGNATYACSYVGEEYLVKQKDRSMKFLGVANGLGFLLISAQVANFEGDMLLAVHRCTSS